MRSGTHGIASDPNNTCYEKWLRIPATINLIMDGAVLRTKKPKKI